MTRQRTDLTFKYNLKRGRHGWIRLTPAYSIKAVHRYLDTKASESHRVLDPFSGSGTTGLVCATSGVESDLVELNPFLVWLANAKTRHYSETILEEARDTLNSVITRARHRNDEAWTPPIYRINRWWSPNRLEVLSHVHSELKQADCSEHALDLLLVAFCRLVIMWSNAAFNHQSMSFKSNDQLSSLTDDVREAILDSFNKISHQIIDSAQQPILTPPSVIEGDSRNLNRLVEGSYTQVITSPPYPNRMSYIRELRPYMYWLGYLTEASEASALDWEAIGGTWGSATSRLNDWSPPDTTTPSPELDTVVEKIATTGEKNAELMATYVQRYFTDISEHFRNLRPLLASGGEVVYVIGNSTFYGVLVPAEELYADIMRKHGFVSPKIEVLRKRNSKKELFEYAVRASAP